MLKESPLLVTVLTALCFGSWTFLPRMAGLGTIPSAFIIEVVAVAVVVAAYPLFPPPEWAKITWTAAAIVTAGALINGLGILGNLYMVIHGPWPLAKYQVMVVGLLQVVTVFVGVVIFKERLSTEEWVLICVIGACVVRLSYVHGAAQGPA